jgi:UDP-glucose 4-epimerase
MKKKILVTGGAGYIGSHTVKQLGEAGYDIVIYDNLSTGFSKNITHGSLIVGDLKDKDLLYRTFSQHQFEAVLHFAASISVPESLEYPVKYYQNNTLNTLNLLECCHLFKIPKFIFSSTAAVYGQPTKNPIDEQTPTNPLNPYGSSKLMSEKMIQDIANSSGMRYVILRYFNVAGADPSGNLGQLNPHGSHLIKMACDAVLGRKPFVKIFGIDYPTHDGTGIRDYIHVYDLARAHLDALTYLNQGNPSEILNCGYGQGYSVRDVLKVMKKVSGVDFPIIETERREGDPASVIAFSDRIKKVLGWKPEYNDLEIITKSSLEWEKKIASNYQLNQTNISEPKERIISYFN